MDSSLLVQWFGLHVVWLSNRLPYMEYLSSQVLASDRFQNLSQHVRSFINRPPHDNLTVPAENSLLKNSGYLHRYCLVVLRTDGASFLRYWYNLYFYLLLRHLVIRIIIHHDIMARLEYPLHLIQIKIQGQRLHFWASKLHHHMFPEKLQFLFLYILS